MRKKKTKKENLDSELSIKTKLKIIANILDSLSEILVLMNPLIDKILSLEEAEFYHRNGTFKQMENLFDNISNQSRKLIKSSIPFEIFKDLKN